MVVFVSPKDGQAFCYDADQNIILKSSGKAGLPDLVERLLMQEFLPESWEGQLRHRTSAGGEVIRVRRTQEGQFVRFDSVAKYGRYTFENVVLVEPRTNLIQEMRVHYREGSGAPTGYRVMRFTYGQPAIQSIYDLGVPGDAKVVEADAGTDVSTQWATESPRRRSTTAPQSGPASQPASQPTNPSR